MTENNNGWNSQRVAAVVRLLVMLVAAILGGFGIAFDTESVVTIVSFGIAFLMGVYNWWKNNNVTQAAQQAQNYLDAIRKEDN